MTAHIELQINHPGGPGEYSPRRGNYQVLPNGNIFMGWSEQGVQSEHTADGTILFESVFAVEWLGTYRQYKFPYVGDPQDPPDVHAEAIGFANGTATTLVWVSWNGATEVASWDMYRTTKNGEKMELLASAERLGFETALAHGSFASHIVVKARDRNGLVLDQTNVFKTIVNTNVTKEAIAEGNQWLYDNSPGIIGRLQSIIGNPIAAFFVGFICSAVIILVGWQARRKGVFRFIGKPVRYQRLKEDSAFEPFTEDSDEQALPLRSSRKESLDDGR